MRSEEQFFPQKEQMHPGHISQETNSTRVGVKFRMLTGRGGGGGGQKAGDP